MQASKLKIRQLDRLKRRSGFLRVQREGGKWVSRSVILQAAPNEDGAPRIGFTVSKKVDKSAVKRNRIRRRLKAAVADVFPDHAKEGTDYVLIGRPATASTLYTDLKNDLKWCLKKLGYLKE